MLGRSHITGCPKPQQAHDASNRLRPAVLAAMMGGTWEGAHARHEAAGVRQPARRRGGCVAARDSGSAGDNAADRLSGPPSPDAFSARLAAFENGLAEAGFSENRNVEVIYRWAHDEADRLPRLAADLVNRNVNVIATTGGPASAFAVKRQRQASRLSSQLPVAILSNSVLSRA